MVKRLLSCVTSDFNRMKPYELKQSILASEGRTVLSENVCTREPQIPDVTNSEIARSSGADLILLNTLDLNDPYIGGLPKSNEPIKMLKELVGRPIGVNLEPVNMNNHISSESTPILSEGRKASRKTFEKANEMGFDFICLTGNPGTGVTNEAITNMIELATKTFNGLIIAGKMHGSGTSEPIVDLEAIKNFIAKGADIILVPAIGTVPGLTQEKLENTVQFIKSKNKLTMSAIGTSQESSSIETIRDISLMNKIAGVDIQHIGDSGYSGLAPYENIVEMSKTIRGTRHTIRMISSSINR